MYIKCSLLCEWFPQYNRSSNKTIRSRKKPRTVYCRSYKNFIESDFRSDIEYAPFHVMNVFNDIDDMAWYSSSLIKHVVDHHAPVKSKTVSAQSVPYMNYAHRKAQYRENMARNKFKKYGKSSWEENRRLRNLVLKFVKSPWVIILKKDVQN